MPEPGHRPSGGSRSTAGDRAASDLLTRHRAAARPIGRLDLPAVATVVVVPHPDDEALATGGLIARQAARGAPVHVVAVTDGDAAYEAWTAGDLAQIRRTEQATALDLLAPPGAGSAVRVTRLGLPDGRVADHEDRLTDALVGLIGRHDLLVAPAPFDWHPDHEACGRAAGAAAVARGVGVLGSLFWSHHHPERADGYDYALVALALDPHEVELRRQAIDAHASQLAPTGHDPVVPDRLLRHLRDPVEHYVVDVEERP